MSKINHLRDSSLSYLNLKLGGMPKEITKTVIEK